MKKRIFKAVALIGLASVLFISCGKKGLVLTGENQNGNEAEQESVESSESEAEASFAEAAASETGAGEEILVYVCGAVRNPGIVNLSGDARIKDALDAAGGFAPGASTEEVNLAQRVTDGMKIRFPYEGEEGDSELSGSLAESENGLVNINTADEKGLTAIPGIGETRARAIVEYREKNGKFQSIEDIMRVNGIKEGTFEKIKEFITVGK